MKRIILWILSLLSLLFLLCACSDRGGKEPLQQGDENNNTVVFTDDAQQKVCVSKNPEKVAVLFSSLAETVKLAGGKVDVTVGEAVERGFANESAVLVDDGAGKKIDAELLIAQKPDFVVGSYEIAAHRSVAELLSSAGIPTALFHMENFDDYSRIMEILCEVFDNEQSYTENVENVEKKIENALSKVPKTEKKSILFVRCASSAKATKAKTKKENFVCEMLDELNTYNIAESAPVLLDGLSIEEIIIQNPDYIFFSAMGDENSAREYMTSLLESEEWQTLDAVKNKKYVFLDKELFHFKPNNRWGEAYETLVNLLYGKKENE